MVVLVLPLKGKTSGDTVQLVYITIVVVYGNNYSNGLMFKATQDLIQEMTRGVGK